MVKPVKPVETPLRLGVIGVGRMGAHHARNLAGVITGARLSAIADPNGAALLRVKDELGVEKAYVDFTALLSDAAVDAIVIAAPANTRLGMLKACIEAGKPIFCEKPVAADLGTTRSLRELVESSGVTYQLGFMRRFDPSYAHAYRRIKDGAIGRPVFIRLTSRDASGPPVAFIKASGGLFVDSSVHDFDLARWLVGDEVDTVYAQGGCFIYPDYADAGDIDVGAVTLKFQNGAIGLHDNSRHSGYGYDIRTEVLGTEGAIQIGYLNGDSTVLLKRGHGNYEYVQDFLIRFADAYRLEMEHFVQCVRSGQTPSIGIRDGEKALAIAEAARTSLATGQPEAVL